MLPKKEIDLYKKTGHNYANIDHRLGNKCMASYNIERITPFLHYNLITIQIPKTKTSHCRQRISQRLKSVDPYLTKLQSIEFSL